MVKKVTRQYEMLMRGDQFGAKHPELFPPGSLGASSLADLGGIVKEVTFHEVGRRGAEGEGVNERFESRKALIRTLKKVRQTSQLLAIADPPVGDSFPKGNRRLADRALLQMARSYARDAAPLADRFIGHGMPATFMADLQAEIDAFAGALDRKQQGRSSAGEAKSQIRSAIGRGLLAVKQLDAFLANTLEHDDPRLEAWKRDRRIGPSARSRKADPGASADAGTSTGTPTTPKAPTSSVVPHKEEQAA